MMKYGLDKLPPHMHEGVLNYLDYGIPPGSFLRAVLCNDLAGAAVYADDVNRAALPVWGRWLVYDCPFGAWGSSVAVTDWLDTFV